MLELSKEKNNHPWRERCTCTQVQVQLEVNRLVTYLSPKLLEGTINL